MMESGKVLRALGRLFLVFWVVLGVGCATPEGRDDRPARPAELEQVARDFHINMRWGRYEHAYDAVHEAYLQSFMGRYEELGKDFRVVDMTMKSAELKDDGYEAIVEVDQEWYLLPDTTVKEDRFVERWVSVEGSWKLRERLSRDEYRELGRVFPSAESEREAEVEEERSGEGDEGR